jgi:methylenetetrahydrofolate reductase (NADPH)
MPEPHAGGAALVRDARFEVIPMKHVGDAIAALPAGIDVSVTCSPVKGIDATLDVVAELVARGHHSVPHLAARMVTDTGHVRAIAGRLRRLGVREVFVIAGDSPRPHGPFAGALPFLRALLDAGAPLDQVGFACYPDGHPLIDDASLHEALMAKQALLADAGIAAHTTSQMCFHPDTVIGWLERSRRLGFTVPLKLGVAGVVDRTKLVSLGVRLGVGSSLRYLRKNVGVLKVLGPSHYDPSQIVEPLAAEAHRLDIAGVHVFTFNQVARTAQWRRRLLGDVAGSA